MPDEPDHWHRVARDAASFLPRIEIETMLREMRESIANDRKHDITNLRFELQQFVRESIAEFLPAKEIDARTSRRWFNVSLPVSENPDYPGEPERKIVELIDHLREHKKRSESRENKAGRVLGWAASICTIGGIAAGGVAWVLHHISIGMHQ